MDETAVQDGTQADTTIPLRNGTPVRNRRGGDDLDGIGTGPTSGPPWYALPPAEASTQTNAAENSLGSQGAVPAASLPDTDLIRLALHKILSSPEFASADQLRAFLRYVVEATCQLPPVTLKGYTIATEALGRGYDFNPTTDPIVRVEAARLRKRLQDYYAGTGQEDPIRIEIPKGSYVPQFILQRRPALPDEPQMGEPSAVPAAPPAPSDQIARPGPELPLPHPAAARPPEPAGFARLFSRRPELVGLVAVVSFVAGLVIGGI